MIARELAPQRKVGTSKSVLAVNGGAERSAESATEKKTTCLVTGAGNGETVR
jgi:hypothetical protein